MNGCITLAVPNFNNARYLRRTLESLRAAGENVRWWLQDNASTDGSLEIAQEFATARDVIRSEPDRGQTDALNRAFSQMGGDIIGYLNSDDCLCDGAAEVVLQTFRDHPEVDLVYGEVEMIDAGDEMLRLHSGDISNLAEVLDIYSVWWCERQWVQPEVFWRRSLWEKVGPFNERYNLAFDFEYWTRCFRAGARVKKIAQPLARFRIHDAQKSAASEKAAYEIRTIVREQLASADLSFGERMTIGAQLSYDMYQSGQSDGVAEERPPFPLALLRHPQWLFAPAARRRLREACARRLSLS